MKTRLFIWAIFALPVVGWGQSDKKDQVLSNAEMFSDQAGVLFEKEFVDVGSVKGLELQIVRITNVITGKKINSLRFEYEVKSTYSSDTKRASLDDDELDGLIKSMQAIQTNVFPTTRENYTEVTFRSRTGLEAGAYYDVQKKLWQAYVQVDRYGKGTVFLNVDEFGKLLGLVEKAKGMM